MTDIIDPILYKDLKACDPIEVTSRTGCTFNDVNQTYQVQVWNRRYDVCPFQNRIRVAKGEAFKEYMDLFVLYYLLKATRLPLSDQWVSEKDIPSGAAFFRGPHTLPTHLIAEKFGNSLDTFNSRCQELDGTPLSMADAAYAFKITPSIPVAVLLWLGDEDFGAEAKLLFDRTIGMHLPLDIIFALAVEVCRQVSK